MHQALPGKATAIARERIAQALQRIEAGDATLFDGADHDWLIGLEDAIEKSDANLVKAARAATLPPGHKFAGAELRDRIYSYYRGHKLRKLSAKKDQIVWTYEAKTQTLPATVDWRGWAVATGPHVLFASADREIVAIKAADGKPDWRYEAPDFTGLPLLHKGRLYFTQKARGLVALDVATGKPAWESAVRDPEAHSPIVWKDAVYFWHSDGYMIPAF